MSFLHCLRDVLKQRREKLSPGSLCHAGLLFVPGRKVPGIDPSSQNLSDQIGGEPRKEKERKGDQGRGIRGMFSLSMTSCQSFMNVMVFGTERLLHELQYAALVGKTWGESSDLLQVW